MISGEMEKLYPSAKTLVKECVASRIFAKDATLYDFSEEAQKCAENFMGWADLASHPQCDIKEIQAFADEVVADGYDTVVLIGQGGSTQAPMTITKYNKQDSNRVKFRTLDSDSPVRMRELLSACNPATTLVVISSKSGGTIEPRLLSCALRESFAKQIGEEAVAKNLVAITDPGSDLEKQAKAEGWRAVFSGEPTVGGRFSALSVFGLLPAALAGIDLDAFIEHAVEAEQRCSEDAIDNPAINLAAFLYDNYHAGRNKFSFLTPKRGRVLGLWIEQLVAESVGKEGQGILPNIEIDSLLLTEDPGDRSVIMYQTKTDLWDERRNFEMSLAYVDSSIPRQNYRIDSVEELAEHFVMWEYAIAMCGYLMKVCPFDQPDVASAKAVVLDILREGQPAPDYEENFTDEIHMGTVEVRQAPMFEGCDDMRSSLYALLSSVQPGDFFALNAFLPFTGEGRREALEAIRHGVAEAFGVVSCLEVGPRYLHSTGQLQKGGPNCGVFLILSADELKDIPLPREAESLGALAKAQASGDLITLANRGRRCVHLHLPDNSGVTLRMLAQVVHETITEIMTDRALAEEAAAAEDRESEEAAAAEAEAAAAAAAAVAAGAEAHEVEGVTAVVTPAPAPAEAE
ncbi:glucose-6-phosphate isomerase [Adlercreutzia sp. ZJ473]|uniref:glucose-6-phosphate isomerase n=1 Tax=Adlercreutzia sp. ZJ473 TaxID=2722822 RepID=UPI001552E0C6|nr:glucose-6-phosphate isomerase [Adlercreutzia sp. ZJ473]